MGDKDDFWHTFQFTTCRTPLFRGIIISEMAYVVEEDTGAQAEESKIQKARRDHDEKSTANRAAILGLPYLDSREFEDQLDLGQAAGGSGFPQSLDAGIAGSGTAPR